MNHFFSATEFFFHLKFQVIFSIVHYFFQKFELIRGNIEMKTPKFFLSAGKNCFIHWQKHASVSFTDICHVYLFCYSFVLCLTGGYCL